ncbi:MAG: hypothetical protein ABL974_02200 [Prosthecobacter sp.]
MGLLCNWKQERGTVAQDRFQNFMTWLEQHHFNELRDKIQSSEALARDLNQLLREDNEVLGAKLDVISTGISSLARRIDSLRVVAESFDSPRSILSDQAVELLRYFDHTGAPRMVVFDPDSNRSHHIKFLPKGGVCKVADVRFMEADLARLTQFDFIRQVDSNSSGQPIYAITREGAAFAAEVGDERSEAPEQCVEPPALEMILI